MKRLTGLVLALGLAGCGSGEDFALEIAGTPAETASALAGITFADEQADFADFKVATERSGDEAITYTMPVVDYPGHTAGQAVVALRLEPVAGKTATRVRATLDVPPTRVLVGKANQVISEEKVAAALKRALAGGDKAKEVRAVLTGVAIGSSADLQARLNSAPRIGAKAEWGEQAEASDWGNSPVEVEAGGNEPSDWGEG